MVYHSPLTGRVYARLKRAILTARIRPGTRVGERELAAELRVSRTPVREAIARLVAEGLIQRRAGRGYVLPTMGVQEAADLYAVREALETLAVRLALERMTPPSIRRLEQEVETLARASLGKDGAGGGRPGVRLHDLIVRASGNDSLYEAWQRILDKIIPYMWIEMLYADDAVQTVEDHRELCRHFRARDAVAAEALLRSHIGRARDNLVRVLTAQKLGAEAPRLTAARGGRRGRSNASRRHRR